MCDLTSEAIGVSRLWAGPGPWVGPGRWVDVCGGEDSAQHTRGVSTAPKRSQHITRGGLSTAPKRSQHSTRGEGFSTEPGGTQHRTRGGQHSGTQRSTHLPYLLHRVDSRALGPLGALGRDLGKKNSAQHPRAGGLRAAPMGQEHSGQHLGGLSIQYPCPPLGPLDGKTHHRWASRSDLGERGLGTEHPG